MGGIFRIYYRIFSQNNIKEVIIVAGYLGNLIYNEFNNKNYKGS